MGFYKQATHRRPGDESFLLWGPTFMTGDGPKMVHFGPKGSKGTKMVNLSVFDHLGPFWTILDKNDFFAPNGQSRGWQRCFGAKYQFLFDTVQKGPVGPKRVPNGQKHLG